MQQPLNQFSHEEIEKNSIIALYANEDLDNKGLPFFLGKVLRVFNKNEKDDDDDDDDGQSDEGAPEYYLEIHEYIQTEINKRPTGKHILHNGHGETKKGSKSTKAKAVITQVEIAQIGFLIEKMNSDKSIPKNTMKLLSFNCEVAARRKIFVCPGWRKFALDLGLWPMPELEE